METSILFADTCYMWVVFILEVIFRTMRVDYFYYIRIDVLFFNVKNTLSMSNKIRRIVLHWHKVCCNYNKLLLAHKPYCCTMKRKSTIQAYHVVIVTRSEFVDRRITSFVLTHGTSEPEIIEVDLRLIKTVKTQTI